MMKENTTKGAAAAGAAARRAISVMLLIAVSISTSHSCCLAFQCGAGPITTNQHHHFSTGVTAHKRYTRGGGGVLNKSLLSLNYNKNKNDDDDSSFLQPTRSDRRRFVSESLGAFLSTTTAASLFLPTTSNAAIDVSGLPLQGGGIAGGSGGGGLKEQLRAYDGSGATRVQEIREAASSSPSRLSPLSSSSASSSPPSSSKAATFALRYGDTNTRLTTVGLGIKRYDDVLVGANDNKRVSVSFEFPFDWLQLDKATGGIQYVDQRNGDKLYVLKASLPKEKVESDNADADAATAGDGAAVINLNKVPRAWFGDVIFDPEGSVVKTGTTVEDYRATKSTIINESPPRRRLILKYATVTGNGLRVERRGLLDAYQIGGEAYMMLTSSNAVKFEKGGIERDTVEAIVDSFRVDSL